MPVSFRGCLVLCFLFILSVSSAIGTTPRVLDVIPREQILVAVAVDRLDTFDSKLRQFMTVVGDDAFPALSEILRLMGFQEGLNMTGSAACVQVAPSSIEPNAEESASLPAAVYLLPIAQQEAFLKGVNASKDPDTDVWRFEVAGTVYYTSVVEGGYLACSEEVDSVNRFSEAGHLQPHESKWGTLGRQIATNSDVVIVGDVKKLAAAANALSSSLPGSIPQPGKDIPDQARDLGIMQSGSLLGRLARLLRDESQGGIAGLTILSDGLRVDLGASFFEGSVLANASQQGMQGDSAISLLPKEPFFAAIGIDAAHPGIRMLADELSLPGRVPGIHAELERLVLGSIASMENLALGIYTPPNLMFGSLSRTMVGWSSPTPESTSNAFREWVTTLNNRPLESAIPPPGKQAPPEGVPVFTATYAQRPGTLGGATAEDWSITPPKNAFPWMPILLGPAPSIDGIQLHLDDRAYLTWTRETALLGKAAGLTRKEDSLMGDALLTSISKNLPSHRAAEAYLDITPIVAQFGMFAGKGGPLSEYPKPAAPIGAALTAQNSSAQLTVIIPAPVLKLGWKLQTAAPPQGR